MEPVRRGTVARCSRVHLAAAMATPPVAGMSGRVEAAHTPAARVFGRPRRLRLPSPIHPQGRFLRVGCTPWHDDCYCNDYTKRKLRFADLGNGQAAPWCDINVIVGYTSNQYCHPLLDCQ
ncbi:hypothetical protein OQA88_10305 [Cercophora sp. LCS_1]